MVASISAAGSEAFLFCRGGLLRRLESGRHREDDRHGVGEIHRRKLRARGKAQGRTRVGALLLGQAAALRPEDERDPAGRGPRQIPGQLGQLQRPTLAPSSQGGGRDDDFAVGDRLGQRLVPAQALEDIVRAGGETDCFLVRRGRGLDETERGGSEVLRDPGHGPQVGRQARSDEDDRGGPHGQGLSASAASRAGIIGRFQPYNLTVRRVFAALVLAMAALPGPAQDLPTYSESAGTEYVMLPVVVLDRKGRFVEGLEKKDFRVQVHETPVDLDTFERDDNAPVSFGFLVDVSGSMEICRKARESEGGDPADHPQPPPGRRFRALRVCGGRSAPRLGILSRHAFAPEGPGRARGVGSDGPLRRGRGDPEAHEGEQRQTGHPPLHGRRGQREPADFHRNGRDPAAGLHAGLSDRLEKCGV